jgi:superfamily II DNA or RNA helicase
MPEQTASELRALSREQEWRDLVQELEAELGEAAGDGAATAMPDTRRRLRRHQVTALDAWRQAGNRGILEHATGSGKTTTAIAAIRERLAAGDSPIVLVPSTPLLRQWSGELKTQLADLDPKLLVCGGGDADWVDGMVRNWLARPASEARIVLAILNSAASDAFLDQVRSDHVLLVVDEVHRAGSPTFSKVLDIDSASRLGLSATPRRYGDPIGTQRLLEYFGGIVHSYSLEQAITDGYLTPYTYHPEVVRLSDGEQEEWDEATARIGRRIARLRGGRDDADDVEDRQLKLMLVARARIAKGAQSKVGLAVRVLTEEFQIGDRWLIYCDDRTQMAEVRERLQTATIDSLAYYDGMPGDPALTLREFELNGGVIVAIKCLDEGVDIPNATHALILASSKNRREFIQRRGRVLRSAPYKPIAHIFDAIVMPGEANHESTFGSMLWSELARGVEFARAAMNLESQTRLELIAHEMGLDVAGLAELGYEDDVDEEGDQH